MTAQKTPSLRRILSNTWRIISAQPRNFSALSVLFILPISLSAVIYPFLLQPMNTSNSSAPSQQLTIAIIYLLFSLTFSFCSGASITYTTFHGFYGKPVKLISSLRSILVSFLPLLATSLVSQVILGSIVFCFTLFMGLAYGGLLLSGVEIAYDSPYFIVSVFAIAAVLVAGTVYVQVGWCLTTAVVVVESRWGFAPLKRSWYLVKGMRWVVFGMVLLFGVPSGILSMWYSSVVRKAGGGNGGGDGGTNNIDISWGFVVEMIVCVGIWTVLSLYSTAATTVLFIYCKELRGEETAAFEKEDEEFGQVYAQLPYKDSV